MMPRYSKKGFDAGKPLFDYLAQLGKEKNATPGQLALAWMLCKKSWIVPIPGSRKENRLRENFGAGDVVLTAEEIAQIDRMLDGIELPVFGKKR